MPIGSVAIGKPDGPQQVIYLGSYNPADAYTQALSTACVAIACETIGKMSVDEIHAFMREHFPGVGKMLDYVEAGQPVPVEYPQNTWPVTPGAESQEIPIIEELKKS